MDASCSWPLFKDLLGPARNGFGVLEPCMTGHHSRDECVCAPLALASHLPVLRRQAKSLPPRLHRLLSGVSWTRRTLHVRLVLAQLHAGLLMGLGSLLLCFKEAQMVHLMNIADSGLLARLCFAMTLAAMWLLSKSNVTYRLLVAGMASAWQTGTGMASACTLIAMYYSVYENTRPLSIEPSNVWSCTISGQAGLNVLGHKT